MLNNTIRLLTFTESYLRIWPEFWLSARASCLEEGFDAKKGYFASGSVH
jgi:hypothetical protein